MGLEQAVTEEGSCQNHGSHIEGVRGHFRTPSKPKTGPFEDQQNESITHVTVQELFTLLLSRTSPAEVVRRPVVHACVHAFVHMYVSACAYSLFIAFLP